MAVLYTLTICLLLLVDISFARHKSSWSVVSPFLNHHASTSSRLLQSNDDSINVYNQLSNNIVSHSKETYINEALYKVATTYGGSEDNISENTHITSSSSLPTKTNLESLLSIRGGASSSSSNNNAIQNIIKSILDFPSLPSPIKQIIEMICQFIESITGFKVLPSVEKKRKTKSKAKKSSSSSSRSREKKREEKVLVEEVSVNTKKKKTPYRKTSTNQNLSLRALLTQIGPPNLLLLKVIAQLRSLHFLG